MLRQVEAIEACAQKSYFWNTSSENSDPEKEVSETIYYQTKSIIVQALLLTYLEANHLFHSCKELEHLFYFTF